MSTLPLTSDNGEIRPMTEQEYAEHIDAIENYVPPIPSAVSMRQMRLAIAEAKKITAVNNAIKAIADEDERTKVQIEWEHSAVVDRNAMWFKTIMDGIKYTEEDIDNLFVKAAAL
jgi:hypothetical protein